METTTRIQIAVAMLGLWMAGVMIGVGVGKYIAEPKGKIMPMQSDQYYSLEEGELISYPKSSFMVVNMDSVNAFVITEKP